MLFFDVTFTCSNCKDRELNYVAKFQIGNTTLLEENDGSQAVCEAILTVCSYNTSLVKF